MLQTCWWWWLITIHRKKQPNESGKVTVHQWRLDIYYSMLSLISVMNEQYSITSRSLYSIPFISHSHTLHTQCEQDWLHILSNISHAYITNWCVQTQLQFLIKLVQKWKTVSLLGETGGKEMGHWGKRNWRGREDITAKSCRAGLRESHQMSAKNKVEQCLCMMLKWTVSSVMLMCLCQNTVVCRYVWMGFFLR